MKRRFAQLIVSVALYGSFISNGYEVVAQDFDKETRREMKKEQKIEKELEKNDRWIAKQESKMIKRRLKDRRFNTPLSARGSEVRVYNKGEYVTLGYFDSSNIFRSHTQKPER